MKEYLKKLPQEMQGLIHLAGDVALKNNMPAYLVGGCVRDLILGVKNLDLDIVVEGDGIKFAEGLAGKLNARLIRHKRFGTATITVRRNLKIDIATARKETYPQPASLPLVSRGILKDDLARRDFTVNAMAISITAGEFGKLIDLFKGKRDLRNKKIRILHGLSFIDDPTRILRAIRFEKRYEFVIEPKTLAYLREAARLRMLEKVQPQRLRDELVLNLKEECCLKQIKRIEELTGFAFIAPQLRISKKSYQLLRSAKDCINWFKEVFPERRPLDAWLIYFMALVDSLKVNDIKDISNRFGFSRGDQKRILSYKGLNDKFILALASARLRPSKIFSLFEPLAYEAILLIKAKYKNRGIQRHIEDFFEIYNGMHLLISGDDLRRLGVTPGPYYQKIFTKVLNTKLEGAIKTKKEELALVKKIVKKR